MTEMTDKKLYTLTEEQIFSAARVIRCRGDANYGSSEIAMIIKSHAAEAREGSLPPKGLIKHMVERFLAWKLPENFNPDGGISFTPVVNAHRPEWTYKNEPSGTNLLDYTQAEQMVRHMLEGASLAEGSLRTPAAPTWISVEDRLPEFAGTYIVAVDGRGDDGEEYISSLPADWSINDKRWHDLRGWGHDEVTHWMPLPNSPARGEASQPLDPTEEFLPDPKRTRRLSRIEAQPAPQPTPPLATLCGAPIQLAGLPAASPCKKESGHSGPCDPWTYQHSAAESPAQPSPGKICKQCGKPFTDTTMWQLRVSCDECTFGEAAASPSPTDTLARAEKDEGLYDLPTPGNTEEK